MENSSLEETLQDGKLYRNLNSLIVAHLRDNNLNQAKPTSLFKLIVSNVVKVLTLCGFLLFCFVGCKCSCFCNYDTIEC